MIKKPKCLSKVKFYKVSVKNEDFLPYSQFYWFILKHKGKMIVSLKNNCYVKCQIFCFFFSTIWNHKNAEYLNDLQLIKTFIESLSRF